MKNIINYYYNIFIDEFKKVGNRFKFEIDNIRYEFIPFCGNINEFCRVYTILKNNKLYCHEAILNKDNSFFTFYENIPYLLVRSDVFIDKYVDIYEIFSYDISVRTDNSFNWKKLWQEKIDYYEYQMSQMSSKYPMLKKSFNYYVGLTETAINLLNYINDKNIGYNICHRRILYKEKLYNFFNPVEILIDNRTRDIGEYIKINYINNNIKMEDVFSIIEYANFTNTEGILLLSRLLYPSYYFDLYDKIIQEKINEEKINKVIDNNIEYETFIREVYSYLRKNHPIPEIEWLMNKF